MHIDCKIVRFYMVQRIIAGGLHSADDDCKAYTTDLMEKLEQAKADNPNEDALLDDTVASAYCEQFALQTLGKAEREMRENRVNGYAYIAFLQPRRWS